MKSKYPNLASEFVALRSYCRWIPELNRRETWDEVVDRVINFLMTETPNGENITSKVWTNIRKGMYGFNVMPSMRLVATAGKAAKKDNLSIYNCAYLPVDSLESFSELMYILMCGTGAGFSIERENVDKLPVVSYQSSFRRDDYIVEDNREGWAKAFQFALEAWFNGEDVHFDFSKIRAYGTPLITMGGRASGPQPLIDLFDFTKKILIEAAGRKLKPIECHDICCKTAEVVVAGGTRRSACISFSDIDDVEMRGAKKTPIPVQRHMANNSAVYKTKPNSATFLREWSTLAESGTGERGIVNVSNLSKITDTREFTPDMRTNPCGEIILRPYQLCNLSEAVVRQKDDISDLVEKVKTATWLGVIQSTFTHFPFVRPKWRKNCELERLIGVSLTGQLDNPEILTDEVLKQLKKVVIRTAKHAAKILEINVPVAFTCSKPSGTVSQVVDSSSGAGSRYAHFYIRRYRISKADPLFILMAHQGIKYYPEVGQTIDNATTMVVEFPIKSPKTCVTRNDWSCIDQLEWYLKVQQNWSTHNVSNTIYVKDDEWIKVGNWVYENFKDIVGVAFLPYEDEKHSYKLAPYEEITEEQYKKMVSEFPKLDFSTLGTYESETGDTTEAAKTLACTGTSCELK